VIVKVKCPYCGRVAEVSLTTRRWKKPRMNPFDVLRILQGERRGLSTGTVHRLIVKATGIPISLRRVRQILKWLESEGKVTGRVVSRGRRGRTTVWRVVRG